MLFRSKWLCYKTLNSEGILQVKKQCYKPYDLVEIPYPVIVKPKRCGSSLGISVCKNEDELIKKSLKALKYDSELIIEEYLEDMQELSAAFYDDGSIKMSKVELINYSDSFNSNLKGALKALEQLKHYNKKKIIITPGFVECKKLLPNLYLKYAKRINEICDYAYIVKLSTSKILYDLIEINHSYVRSVDEARLILSFNNEAVLIENEPVIPITS